MAMPWPITSPSHPFQRVAIDFYFFGGQGLSVRPTAALQIYLASSSLEP